MNVAGNMCVALQNSDVTKAILYTKKLKSVSTRMIRVELTHKSTSYKNNVIHLQKVKELGLPSF